MCKVERTTTFHYCSEKKSSDQSHKLVFVGALPTAAPKMLFPEQPRDFIEEVQFGTGSATRL